MLDGYSISPLVVQSYFLPFSKNYASVDSLFFYDRHSTIILFQITTACEHNIKSVVGVGKLLKWLLPKTIKNGFLVFVVPEDRVEDNSKG